MAPVAVVGAGAAGLMAALFAAREGSTVVLIEGTNAGGKKIIISGGGRCNILPSVFEPERFVTESSSNSLRKILKSWPLADQRDFFEQELGLPLSLESETGKLFPRSQRASDVRDCLMEVAVSAGVQVWTGTRATAIRITPGATNWTVELDRAPPLDCSSVILATGGLSVPATGSDGWGLDEVHQLGIEVNPTYPALTPLLADPPVHEHLAGISLRVTISVPGIKPRFSTSGGFLFTHRGYSGPAVLDASHYAVRSVCGAGATRLNIRWTDRSEAEWDQELTRGKATVMSAVSKTLPTRLGEQLMIEAGIERGVTVPHLSRDSRRKLVSLLCNYPLPWTGHEGYKKAEVTGGGVALSEIHPVTMESKKHAGLFLCGEILDAFGPIGGHNFLWAWVTGRAAGRGAGKRRTEGLRV